MSARRRASSAVPIVRYSRLTEPWWPPVNPSGVDKPGQVAHALEPPPVALLRDDNLLDAQLPHHLADLRRVAVDERAVIREPPLVLLQQALERLVVRDLGGGLARLQPERLQLACPLAEPVAHRLAALDRVGEPRDDRLQVRHSLLEPVALARLFAVGLVGPGALVPLLEQRVVLRPVRLVQEHVVEPRLDGAVDLPSERPACVVARPALEVLA